jgi:ribosomal protein RSM22 (predicted rRNA methylase)
VRPHDASAAALIALERFLSDAHPGFERDARFVDAARALSHAYTRTRAIDVDAAASLPYLAHFGPRAIAAVAHAVDRGAIDVAGVVVDVGAGSGASALAWGLLGASTVVAVEPSARALALAERLGRSAGVRIVPLTGRADNVSTIAELKKATIVSAAFCIGEWEIVDEDENANVGGVVDAAFARVADSAAVAVVVDAGDHARARRLQRLREHIVGAGLTVRGPCPHRDACPALVRERDWCHDRIEKHLPEKLARFTAAVGVDEAAMSLSWLAWERRPRGEQFDDRRNVVVIGAPQKEKGRVRIPVCGPGGLRFAQALKRDRSAYSLALDLPRGARLTLPANAERSGDQTTWHIHDVDVDVGAAGDVGDA